MTGMTLARKIGVAFLSLAMMSCCSAQPGTQTFVGKLIVSPDAGTQRTYFTGSFQLLREADALIVQSNERVTEDELLTFKDQFVIVHALYVAPRAPDEDKQAPMGLDGPIDHPASLEPLGIEPYDGRPFKVASPLR